MRTKKPTRKQLVKKLDKAFGDYIKARDGYKCVATGLTTDLTCSHLITRSKYSVRWNEDNAVCHTKGVNFRHESYPHYFTQWWIEKYGLQAYNQLICDSNQLSKFTNEDLQEKITYYTNKLKSIEEKK